MEVSIDIENWPDWQHSYPIQVTIPYEGESETRPALNLQDDQRCPLCRDGVTEREELITCAGCHTVLHTECMREFGACSTRGCGRARIRARV